jgi:hypothetical protein
MEAAAASRTTLCALPLALLQSVLARLPVDARARACVVCPAWNTALAERSLWTRLDLSPASGVAVAATEAVLEAAAARAGGQLEALDISGVYASHAALLAVVTANAGALRELRTCSPCGRSPSGQNAPLQTRDSPLDIEEVEELLRAAPLLQAFDAAVGCDAAAAPLALRNVPPFAPLRVHCLYMALDADMDDNGDPQPPMNEAAALTLAGDMAGHTWLREISLYYLLPLHTPAVLDAVLDAALARELTTVSLGRCNLFAGAAVALARLLDGGLARLSLDLMFVPLDVPAALLLGNALRTSTAIIAVQLFSIDLWRDPAAAGLLLLGGITGHPTLRELDLSNNEWEQAGSPAAQAVVGFPLAALVAANAPALRKLTVEGCGLGDAGLQPLFDALPHNMHLRELRCADNGVTEAFARERMLPAVQANTSLCDLHFIDSYGYQDPANPVNVPAVVNELQNLVAARGLSAGYVAMPSWP